MAVPSPSMLGSPLPPAGEPPELRADDGAAGAQRTGAPCDPADVPPQQTKLPGEVAVPASDSVGGSCRGSRHEGSSSDNLCQSAVVEPSAGLPAGADAVRHATVRKFTEERVRAAFRHYATEEHITIRREHVEEMFRLLGGEVPPDEVMDSFTDHETGSFMYDQFLSWLYAPEVPQQERPLTIQASYVSPYCMTEQSQEGNGNGHGLCDTPTPHGCFETRDIETEATEAEESCDLTYERQKSAVAAVSVLTAWAVLLVGIAVLREHFDVAACPELPPREPKPSVCSPCGEGTMFLPLFGEFERAWPRALRACLYFLGLMWMFLGVGIVCDQFMGAIEVITSAQRDVWIRDSTDKRRKVHVKVWNQTIANLTLMALGSSAPEILLAVIEVCNLEFFAGELGPATIVGSAAFNLLVITGVCVSAIPAGEPARKVLFTHVFAVTAAFSLFAYGWLVFILKVSSPDKVDIWEGITTFAMFPLLLVTAFVADRKWLYRCGGKSKVTTLGRQRTWIERETERIQEEFGKELPPETLEKLLEQRSDADKAGNHTSRAQLHHAVMKTISGSGTHSLSSTPTHSRSNTRGEEVLFGFAQTRYSVLDSANSVFLKVVASRAPGVVVQMRYCTHEGSAREGRRYRHREGRLCFQPGQMEQLIEVPLISSSEPQVNESFTVELSEIVAAGACAGLNSRGLATDGPSSTVTSSFFRDTPHIGIESTSVTILSDDMPGTLSFDKDEVYVSEGHDVTVGVVRTRGTCGQISCQYKTVNDTAISGTDFAHIEGTLVFEDGQHRQDLSIAILATPHHEYETNERFKVLLNSPSPGVKFDADRNGGKTCAVCDIIIRAEPHPALMERVVRKCFNKDKFQHDMAQWSNQFIAALYCNGGPVEQSSANLNDWFFHCLSIVWKLLFALIPPPSVYGGWACFFIALGMIGLVTAFISDMASLLGCCVGIPDDITAITLVALGTSLPDTYASKYAAQQDEYADNSIGNITGSNSVNVFLGLGIPWTLASLYWEHSRVTGDWRTHLYKGRTYEELFEPTYPKGGFMVPAGTLTFSVIVFVCCALACLSLLVLRRRLYGGELGGPKSAQNRDTCILILLWAVYITLSIINSLSQH